MTRPEIDSTLAQLLKTDNGDKITGAELHQALQTILDYTDMNTGRDVLELLLVEQRVTNSYLQDGGRSPSDAESRPFVVTDANSIQRTESVSRGYDAFGNVWDMVVTTATNNGVDSSVITYRNGSQVQTIQPTGFKLGAVPAGSSGSTTGFLKAILGGALSTSTGLMNIGLKTGNYIPVLTGDAYTEQVPNVPEIVDRVTVKFFVAQSGPTTGDSNGQLIVARTAWLLNSGKIVEGDGITPLKTPFANTGTGSYLLYRIGIFHRNHLAAFSQPIINSGLNTPISYDFTLTQAQAWQDSTMAGFPAMQEYTVSGLPVYGLVPGDATGDGKIIYQDEYNAVLARLGGNTNAVLSGYYNEDLSMNGQIRLAGVNNDPLVAVASLYADQTATRLTHNPFVLVAPVITNADLTSNGFSLNWPAVPRAQRYKVQRKVAGVWVNNQVTPGLTAFIDSAPGTLNEVRVVAFNAEQDIASNVLTVTTPA